MTNPTQSPWEGLIRAAKLLGVESGGARAEVAAWFGFEYKISKAESRLPDIKNYPLRPPIDFKSRERSIDETQPSAIRGNRIPLTVSRLPEPEVERPSWLEQTLPLPLNQKQSRLIPAKESLLEPRWTRGVLSAALDTIVQSSEIDVSRVVALYAKGELLRTIPYRRLKTLSRGVYCWVDRGVAMEPFYQDQKQLITELKQVVGHSRAWVSFLEEIPAIEDFIPGVPHLIVSDLGLIRTPEDLPRATPQMWGAFAARVGELFDAEVIALVPQRAESYPAAVRSSMRLMVWDRSTSVQTILRLRSE